MKNYSIIICLLLAFCCPAAALVDIAEIGVGARNLGMGRAYTSGVDDASSIFTNPAGLPLNSYLNVTSMSGSLFSDINYMSLGLSDTFLFGRYGIGYVNASVGAIPITEISGTGSAAAVVQTGTTDYGSSIIFLSYGSELERFFGKRAGNISVGASLKYFLQGFSGGGVSMQDASGNGMDLDLGMIYDVLPWASLGLTFSNCLPFEYGGKFTWERTTEAAEGIPMVTRMGVGIKILGEKGLQPSNTQALNLNIDYESRREANRPAVWHTGLEFWPTDILAFRLGLDQKPRADVLGVGVDNNLSAGVGVKYIGFTFDYAYHQFGDLAENATHFFSIGYRGIEEEVKKYVREKKQRKAAIPRPEIAPKPELASFTDIPEDHWARKQIEYLATLNIMGGYPDGSFRPHRPLTRGELAALLVKAKGFEVKNTDSTIFKDVGDKDWAAPYIAKAVERTYIKGYPDGTFRPSQRITRAEAAMVFSKFSGLYVKPQTGQQSFPDVSAVHWVSPALAAAQKEGFYEYLAGKDFKPDEFLTRAEAAEILSKTPFVKEQIKALISGDM